MSSLAGALGFDPDDRVVLVTCDHLGMSHSTNVAGYRAMRAGWATGASLMVPCPWSREAAQSYRGDDVGAHLTLLSEYETYRWGPTTQAPSLLGGEGGFPRTLDDLWEHADLDEVARECRAQVERAVLWGFDLSHLTSHQNALALRPEFFDVLVELATEYSLPIRLPNPEQQARIGFPVRELAAAEGIVFPDRVVTLSSRPARTVTHAGGTHSGPLDEAFWRSLEPGVTELVVHPGADTPELRAYDPSWADRVATLALLVDDPAPDAAREAAGVHAVSWRALRSVMRRRS